MPAEWTQVETFNAEHVSYAGLVDQKGIIESH